MGSVHRSYTCSTGSSRAAGQKERPDPTSRRDGSSAAHLLRCFERLFVPGYRPRAGVAERKDHNSTRKLVSGSPGNSTLLMLRDVLSLR